MKEFDLKPCPFCGFENPELDATIVADEYFGLLCCRHCGGGFVRCCVQCGSFEEFTFDLTKLWNRRADQEVAQDG